MNIFIFTLGPRHSDLSPYTHANFLQSFHLESLKREKPNCPEKIPCFRIDCIVRNRYNLHQVLLSPSWTNTQTYASDFMASNLSIKSQIPGVRLKSKPLVVCEEVLSLFSCHFLEEDYLKTKLVSGHQELSYALNCLISRLYSSGRIPLSTNSQEMTAVLRYATQLKNKKNKIKKTQPKL